MSQPIQPPNQQPPGSQQPPNAPIVYAAGPPPQPGKPPKRKRFGFMALTIAGLTGLLLGVLMGSGGEDAVTTAAPQPRVTVTETAPAEEAEPAPTVTVTETAEAEPPAEEPADTAGVPVEGMNEVGVDVKPGRYRTVAPADGSGCYWARLKDDTGSGDDIIANDITDPGARVSVTIKKSDGFFESNGCGEWQRQ